MNWSEWQNDVRVNPVVAMQSCQSELLRTSTQDWEEFFTTPASDFGDYSYNHKH